VIEFRADGIVLDIEGTTSSIAYVYEILFAFARAHLADFLAAHGDAADTAHACRLIAEETGQNADDRAAIAAEALKLMDRDVKSTGLKALQGLVWRGGYESGTLRSHVYADVPGALRHWRALGLRVWIYSSGSIAAQQLFFRHTESGDLLPWIEGHFDTTVGPKRDAASYACIADRINLPPSRILFCSDIVEELDAAHKTGMQTVLLCRPGNAAARPGHGHAAVERFDQLHITPY
jgi:enolase-phosphatase E1